MTVPVNRLLQESFTDGALHTYTYDNVGNGRYYDPATARFLSEDPLREAKDPEHATGPNLFAYVKNDPVNKLDPSVHDDDAEKKKQEEEERKQAAEAA